MHITRISTLNRLRLIIPAIVAVVIIALAMPKAARFGFDFRKGSPWEHETLVARMDFPIYKTEEQLMEDRLNSESSYVPYYRQSEEVLKNAVARLNASSETPLFKAKAVEALTSIYERGILQTAPESEVIYIQRGKRAEKLPASEVFLLNGAYDEFLKLGRELMPGIDVDSIARQPGLISIEPNLFFDEETTELIASGAEHSVSPTSGYVASGQIIVSEGEIVTAEIAQMLDSYKKEYAQSIGKNMPGPVHWAGAFMISFCLVFILLLILCFTMPHILTGWRRYSYILTIFVLGTVASMLACIYLENVIFIVPFTLTALYFQAFFKNSEIVPVYAVSLIPLLLFANNGAVMYVMYLIAGVVSILMFRKFSRGWRQFVVALETFGVLAVIYLAFRMADMMSGSILKDLFLLFCGSMLTVAFYPLIYLFEKVFNLVSVSRMLELSETTNPILQELQQKAPGTFQHSLQVMNMADAAASAIGANVPMVRVGALYHDIGKIMNPLCFIENESILSESKVKYHEGLTPEQSAKDIIRHVTDGLAIAKKHRLPVIIPAFIESHHGTTVTSYFWNKHLEQGGDPSLIGSFAYPGPKPFLKEQIILMLCDSIEAASRTLKEYTPESFDAFVERIVAGKLESGQFENSDISIKELGIIKESIKSYLAQMYHGRIEYPKETKTNKLRLWKSKQSNQTN